MPLADAAVRMAKPRPKAYKLTDSHGLYLEVAPSGSRCWRLKYRVGGKEKRLALGVYPVVTLARARADALGRTPVVPAVGAGDVCAPYVDLRRRYVA
jgi:hypothetical protein